MAVEDVRDIIDEAQLYSDNMQNKAIAYTQAAINESDKLQRNQIPVTVSDIAIPEIPDIEAPDIVFDELFDNGVLAVDFAVAAAGCFFIIHILV